MAGSFKHVVDDDGNYRGVDLLENMGDMHEAVEEMAFMLLWLSQTPGGLASVQLARDAYYKLLRGEDTRPNWFMR